MTPVKILSTEPEHVSMEAPDDRTLLVLMATQLEETFFKAQEEELASPILFLVTRHEAGLFRRMLLVEANDPILGKHAFGRLWQTALEAPGTVGAIQMFEAWMVKANTAESLDLSVAPSRHPERIEALVTNIGLPGGETIMRTTPIARMGGLPVRVSEAEVIDSREMGSAMTGRMLGNPMK